MRKEENTMQEKEYILEHLSDEQYDECFNDLVLAFKNALMQTLDMWVSKGLITKHERDCVMEECCVGEFLITETMGELLG
jgi:hypothetical protein